MSHYSKIITVFLLLAACEFVCAMENQTYNTSQLVDVSKSNRHVRDLQLLLSEADEMLLILPADDLMRVAHTMSELQKDVSINEIRSLLKLGDITIEKKFETFANWLFYLIETTAIVVGPLFIEYLQDKNMLPSSKN